MEVCNTGSATNALSYWRNRGKKGFRCKEEEGHIVMRMDVDGKEKRAIGEKEGHLGCHSSYKTRFNSWLPVKT